LNITIYNKTTANEQRTCLYKNKHNINEEELRLIRCTTL